MKIIFATGNKDKMVEIRQIMGDFDAEILSMKEAGINLDIVEDGTTFAENSMIKARAVAEAYKEMYEEPAIILADDSGLVVDALNGEPGIYSARYLGEDTPYSIKNQAIIDRLVGVEHKDRTARFVDAIGAVFPDGSEEVAEGTIEGFIGDRPAGCHGFGYDPIFYLESGISTAELPEEEKNAISHRGKALSAMKHIITERGLL